MMNYKETIKFLYDQLPAYHRIGKAAYKNDLNNSLALDDYFGHPHLKYRCVHVAGTNGKGSVSHMIASVFMEAGYKTGLYTSPHLKDFRERIKVDGKMIPKEAVTRFVNSNNNFIRSMKPSFFELTVAMAFDYFAVAGVDIAVIEVGLGGRLDSTNIIKPVLSVITNIGHDHMDLLGNTLKKIATEKAGIIKENVPVVIGETNPETSEVFIKKAGETGSGISFADKNFICLPEEFNYVSAKRKFNISEISTGISSSGETALGGDYQSKNIQSVFQAFKSLTGTFELNDDQILVGISNVVKNTRLMGRWQILDKNPLLICDTGHNREGLEYVLGQIKRIPKTKLHIVIGFVNDKDLSSVLPLFPAEAIYYFTKASVPRALDEKTLMDEAYKSGLNGSCFKTVKSALKAARLRSSETDLIFVGGSTFVVAEAI